MAGMPTAWGIPHQVVTDIVELHIEMGTLITFVFDFDSPEYEDEDEDKEAEELDIAWATHTECISSCRDEDDGMQFPKFTDAPVIGHTGSGFDELYDETGDAYYPPHSSTYSRRMKYDNTPRWEIVLTPTGVFAIRCTQDLLDQLYSIQYDAEEGEDMPFSTFNVIMMSIEAQGVSLRNRSSLYEHSLDAYVDCIESIGFEVLFFASGQNVILPM
jgi:hypothetical protein